MKRKTTRTIIRKGKKRPQRKVRQMTLSTSDVLIYAIRNDSLTAVQRLNPKPRDCVINAMEFFGMLNASEAGIARAFVGDEAIMPERVLEAFNVVNSPFTHSWLRIPNSRSFDLLPPSHAMFVAITFSGGSVSHAIVIAKGNDGVVYVIDPQRKEDLGIPGRFVNQFVYQLDEYPWDTVTGMFAVSPSYAAAMDYSD